WKIAADGQTREVQVTYNGGWRSRESFDRQTLYFQKFDLPGLFRMPIGGGPEERVGNIEPPQDWQLVPGAIYYFRNADGIYSVDRLDLKSGRTTEVLKLPTGTAGRTTNFTVSPDGHWLIFAHLDQGVSELMMLENFR